MHMKLPDRFEEIIATISEEELAHRGLTRDQFRARLQARVERDEHSPKLGDPAPDLELERLSSEGARTGELVRLSSFRGRSVGLIFGSYT